MRTLEFLACLLALAASACRESPSAASGTQPPSVVLVPDPPESSAPAAPSATVGSSVPAPSAMASSSATAAPSVTAAPRAAVTLDPATSKRRVFRHVFVGLIRPGRRLTWELLRDASHAQLQISCQEIPTSKKFEQTHRSLTGAENDEGLWGPPIVIKYTGTHERLYLAPDSVADTSCGAAPPEITFSCRTVQASVLAAGAALIPIPGDNSAVQKGRWSPPERELVLGLRCDVSTKEEEGENRWGKRKPFFYYYVAFNGPPIFVEPKRRGAPGIEWAFENSDMIVQEGAYRWMPAP